MRRMYDNLVGLDEIKADMLRKMVLLLEPSYIDHWVKEHYTGTTVPPLVTALKERYPMVVLEGEVGAGKTALARSVGDRLAEMMQTKVAMLVMNAQVRGNGLVGEISKNLVNAFEAAEALQDRERIPVLLLIDEADTLAQARGGRQMHHDDNAGVNTLIQRIDRLRGRYILLLFATNLYQSLDSAILRRAIAVYRFQRPNEQQRAEVFQRFLSQFGYSSRDIAALVERTRARPIPSFDDARRPKNHRYTYSDITQRILPTAIEEAVYAKAPLTMDFVVRACDQTVPTPESAPFE
jgi:SpoVK/Ycf46/Vps4 family AAA+-type ATPase